MLHHVAESEGVFVCVEVVVVVVGRGVFVLEEPPTGPEATCCHRGVWQADGSSQCASAGAAAAQKGLIQADLSVWCACCHRHDLAKLTEPGGSCALCSWGWDFNTLHGERERKRKEKGKGGVKGKSQGKIGGQKKDKEIEDEKKGDVAMDKSTCLIKS